MPDAARPVAGDPIAQTFLRPALKLASIQPGERVVIIGAGESDIAIDAAARVGPTGEALVIDTDQQALDTLAVRAHEAGITNLRFVQGEPSRLGGPDAYWDVVVCHFSLAGLTDPDATLREALRVLRPVGRVILAELGERERCPLITIFIDTVAKHLPAVQAESARLFRYSPTGKLAQLLAEQGFEDAVPDRSTEWIPFPDIEAYWETVTTTTDAGRLAVQLSPEAVAECKTEIERKTRFYRRGGGIELKVEAVILAAVK